MALFALGLLAADAAVVAGFEARGRQRAPASAAAAAGPDIALDWAMCQTYVDGRAVEPQLVAITYLDTEIDRDVTPDQVRGWFGDVDAADVRVSLLEYRWGARRIAFELGRDRWPEWDRIAGGAQGRELCGRLRAALLARGVGRPQTDPDSDRSRHGFEFIHERRAKLYRSVSRIGPLDDFLEPEAFADAQRWLDETPEQP